MIWKVCGMRDAVNIAEVADLTPNFMGFIFFEKSPRNVSGILQPHTLETIPEKIQKIGVFVNASIEFIETQIADYQLDGVQLHGDESAEMCRYFLEKEIIVLKAFSVDETFDFTNTKAYEGKVSFLLFDTKAPKGHGGHGVSFDWSLLENYTGKTPFLLAGGVSLENIEDVKQLTHPQFAGIDVNSKFEISPALKDIKQLKILKKFVIESEE